MKRSPSIPEVGVLAMPYHHWGTRWMTPHHVLTRLADYFHVLWLEPAHHWSETWSRLRHVNEDAALTAGLADGFRRYVPEPWLPHVYGPQWLSRALLRERVRRGWRLLEARGCRLLVLHLWHPQFEPALDVARHHLSLYHIDDEYTFSADGPPITREEAQVLRRVDQVFAISPALMERKSGINSSMTLVPEGVDFQLYATPIAEPADLAPIARPRIGYTGHLKRQLNWPLLRDLASRHAGWSFVFVGPRTLPPEDAVIVDQMARLPNVHFLGGKTVTDLAAYPQHFDVCTMPYNVNGYTNNIYPLKLHEYLAGGRPVIGTPIRSLRDFTHVIRLATTLDEWSAAIESLLAPPETSESSVARRRAVARQHDWSRLIHRIASTIVARLGSEIATRLPQIDDGTNPPRERSLG